MSGPKHGSYINYRAEIEQETDIITRYLKDSKGLVNNLENSLKLESKEREIIEKHAGEEWKRETEKITEYISNAKNKISKLESSLKITNYNAKNLSKVREIHKEAKMLFEELKDKYNNFRREKSIILSKSHEKAQEYKLKTERELRETIEPSISFLEEWAFDDRVKELQKALENFRNLEFSKIEEERQNILNLYYELQSKALKNKKDFEIKKDTSDKLMSLLIEMNYGKIERSLEEGRTGKIIVKAEAPDESWNVIYEIGNDGEIKTLTPEDDRCFVNLEDINKKLKDYGIQVDIKELQRKEKKKERTMEGKQERER